MKRSHSTTHPNPADLNFAIFFDENIPTLRQTEREHCEGIFSNRACLNALTKMGKNKTSGTDGLTTEFYKYFWNLIGDIVVV